MGTDVSDVKFVRTAFGMYACDEQFWLTFALGL